VTEIVNVSAGKSLKNLFFKKFLHSVILKFFSEINIRISIGVIKKPDITKKASTPKKPFGKMVSFR
jgi:hypothetical protein